jgi:thiol-disulfide isomerase/thioredoxin
MGLMRSSKLPARDGRLDRRRLLAAIGAASLAAVSAGARAADPGRRIEWGDVVLLDGRTLPASELRGRVVVVEFWASWCPFCKKQNPLLQELHATHGGRGLRVLTFSIDREPGKARAYVAEHAYTFPAAMADTAVARQFEPRHGLPELYVVGADGRIVVRESGEMFPEDVRALARYARP